MNFIYCKSFVKNFCKIDDNNGSYKYILIFKITSIKEYLNLIKKKLEQLKYYAYLQNFYKYLYKYCKTTESLIKIIIMIYIGTKLFNLKKTK